MSNETTLDDVLSLPAKWRAVAANGQMDHFYADGLNTCAEALDELLPAIKAALEDARRLDWLDGFTVDSNYTISEYFGSAGKVRYVEFQDSDDSVIATGSTLRESIDNAIAYDAAIDAAQEVGK